MHFEKMWSITIFMAFTACFYCSLKNTLAVTGHAPKRRSDLSQGAAGPFFQLFFVPFVFIVECAFPMIDMRNVSF